MSEVSKKENLNMCVDNKDDRIEIHADVGSWEKYIKNLKKMGAEIKDPYGRLAYLDKMEVLKNKLECKMNMTNWFDC